jgi:hypothetical protein
MGENIEPMKVERYGRNVHRLTFELAANEEQEFLLISDLHIDNPLSAI